MSISTCIQGAFVLEYCCWYTANSHYISVFDALLIGRGLGAARRSTFVQTGRQYFGLTYNNFCVVTCCTITYPLKHESAIIIMSNGGDDTDASLWTEVVLVVIIVAWDRHKNVVRVAAHIIIAGKTVYVNCVQCELGVQCIIHRANSH